jgi:outer membrane protein assembly factor BamB
MRGNSASLPHRRAAAASVLRCAAFLFALLLPASSFAAAATYDGATGRLTLPTVQVGQTVYRDVLVQFLQEPNVLAATGAPPGAADDGTQPPVYDATAQTLRLPLVTVGAAAYSAVIVQLPQQAFSVLAVGGVVSWSTYPVVAVQFGTVRVGVEQRGVFNYPMDGVKVRLVVTNTAATASPGLQFSARWQDSGQSVLVSPEAGHITLAPGASQAVSALAGNLASLPPGATTRTMSWTFCAGAVCNSLDTPVTIVNWSTGQGDVATPTGGPALAVSVRVTDERGTPLDSAFVQARAGSAQVRLSATDAPGEYARTLPPSANWVVSASVEGRSTGWLALTDASLASGGVLVLRPQARSFSYAQAVVRATGVGPWLGRVDGGGNRILMTSGMEHWSGTLARSDARVRLFDTAAQTQLWEFDAGSEVWGGDVSGDGQWAAVATLDPIDPNNPTNSGNPTLSLLAAGTGQLVWQRALSGDLAGRGNALNVRELRFSPDGTALAVGHGNGVLLMDRRDPTRALWSAQLDGHVRAIRFSADGSVLYAASGAGFTLAYQAATGTELWRAPTYTWVHPEGMVLSPDGKRLGVLSAEGDVVMLDAATGNRLWYLDTGQYSWWASFSGDGTVFLAGTQTGATVGLGTSSGMPLFALSGGKGGGFAAGANFFLLAGSAMNTAVYDQNGTQVSNFVQGLDGTFQNWQVAWLSADGRSMFLGQQESTSASQPVIYSVRAPQ